MFQHKFEWDASKAEQNLRAHGITFERAASVFQDPRALSEFDEEHSQDEDRWVTLGLDQTGSLLVVCHTYREESTPSDRILRKRVNLAEELGLSYREESTSSDRIRLISARKATANESRQYNETGI